MIRTGMMSKQARISCIAFGLLLVFALPIPSAHASGFTDNFQSLNTDLWLAATYCNAATCVSKSNVKVSSNLGLIVPKGKFGGAELETTSTVRYGTFSTSMKTSSSKEVMSSIFLYYGKTGDEIDIEVTWNNGVWQVWFTAYLKGNMDYHVEMNLPFDPSASYHSYKMVWTQSDITFYVDGAQWATTSKSPNLSSIYLVLIAYAPHWKGSEPASSTTTNFAWVSATY